MTSEFRFFLTTFLTSNLSGKSTFLKIFLQKKAIFPTTTLQKVLVSSGFQRTADAGLLTMGVYSVVASRPFSFSSRNFTPHPHPHDQHILTIHDYTLPTPHGLTR